MNNQLSNGLFQNDQFQATITTLQGTVPKYKPRIGERGTINDTPITSIYYRSLYSKYGFYMIVV